MKGNMKKVALVFMVTILGVLMAAGAALAGDRHLKGDYAFTGTAVCLSSMDGFNADLTPKTSRIFYESFNVQGVWRFNADGTGKRHGRLVSVRYMPFTFSSSHGSSSEFEAPFTYTIGPNGAISTDLSGPCEGIALTGPNPLMTWEVDKISLKGIVSEDKKTLTIANDEPQIETITFGNGISYPRICNRSRVLIKLEGQGQHGWFHK